MTNSVSLLQRGMLRPYRALARGFASGRRNDQRKLGAAPAVRGEEVAWARGLFFSSVPMERWNPDDLVARNGYGIYRKMLQDDQVRALIALKQSVITARGWHFRTTDDSPQQTRCAEFFRFMLESQLRGTFSQVLKEMLTSQAYGFSLVEKVYEPVLWQGETRWGIAQFKLRPAETIQFAADPHGNLTGIVQQQAGRRVKLPPEKFIHMVNKPEADAHYGESDLRECHRHWWAKDNILKFWNIYLERMAAGFVHGRISGPLTPAERGDLKEVLRNLSSQTSIITPANVDLKMVTAPSTEAFEHAVAARDRAIAKALLVPSLLGFSDQGRTGSYSQSQTQLETFFFVLNALSEQIADSLNEQLFRELAEWNFGMEDPPRFAFDPLNDGQKREYARAWREAVAGGVVTQTPADETRTRELLKYPASA